MGKNYTIKYGISENFLKIGYPKCVRENFSIDGKISLLMKIFGRKFFRFKECARARQKTDT